MSVIMREVDVLCPHDGTRLFRVFRELIQLNIEPGRQKVEMQELKPACKKCNSKRFYDLLKHASKVTLHSSDAPRSK